MTHPKIISVEGNIGAGKSTILKHLEEMYKNNNNVIFLKEPVDVWETIKDNSGETILQKFYGNTEKYAFTFQVMAFVTRLTLLRNTIKEYPNVTTIICERSLEADRQIFAQMLSDDGLIEDIHYKIYLRFYEEFKKDFALNGIIYIDADADVCYNRISKRGRNGEEGVRIEYLENCKKYHDKWLLSNHDDKILKIKTNEEVSYNNDLGVIWLREISEFIETL
jgi:deoxyadenosine/deoxycytidine kinase